VAVGLSADPHVDVGRRNRQCTDALQIGLASCWPSIRIAISEAFAVPQSPDTGSITADINQSGTADVLVQLAIGFGEFGGHREKFE
jgi:hypothetical protein